VNTILFALGAMLCWGIGDFLIQCTARKIGDIEALAWIGIIGSVVLLPFVIPQLHLLSNTSGLLLLLLLGVVTFIAAIFDLEALKIGKISVVDMVITLELPMTIVLGVLFMHDTISLWQFIIILFAFWGVSLISVEPKQWRFKLEKGVWLALAAAFVMAFVNFLTAHNAQTVSPLLAIWVPWVVFTIICLAVMARREEFHSFSAHVKQYTVLIVCMGIFDTAAWLSYAYATRAGELSIVTAITESYPAVAVLLGVWINRERIHSYQWLGVAIALIASVLLALTL
jgi:drug/metabolite transporter (DMT)-like permease